MSLSNKFKFNASPTRPPLSCSSTVYFKSIESLRASQYSVFIHRVSLSFTHCKILLNMEAYFPVVTKGSSNGKRRSGASLSVADQVSLKKPSIVHQTASTPKWAKSHNPHPPRRDWKQFYNLSQASQGVYWRPFQTPQIRLPIPISLNELVRFNKHLTSEMLQALLLL